MDIEGMFAKPQAEAPEPEVKPEIVEQPVVEAPVEAPAEPVVEAPEPEAAVTPEPTDRAVPLGTFLEMRDKAKAEAAQRAALEARIAELTPQPQRPDPLDDPDGFRSSLNQEFQQGLLDQKMQMSNVMAVQQHGDDVVKESVAWAFERCNTDPVFNEQVKAQVHPIDWIVRQHKAAVDLADYSKDPLAFAQRILASHGQAVAPTAPVIPAVAAPQQAFKPTPPRSLASAPSSGGAIREVPTGPMASLEATFK